MGMGGDGKERLDRIDGIDGKETKEGHGHALLDLLILSILSKTVPFRIPTSPS